MSLFLFIDFNGICQCLMFDNKQVFNKFRLFISNIKLTMYDDNSWSFNCNKHRNNNASFLYINAIMIQLLYLFNFIYKIGRCMKKTIFHCNTVQCKFLNCNIFSRFSSWYSGWTHILNIHSIYNASFFINKGNFYSLMLGRMSKLINVVSLFYHIKVYL